MYGCETWSLILREVYILRVLEKRRIFGPKGDEIVGDRRRMHMRSFITCNLSQVGLLRIIK
jgi:hypothetical protein